MKHFLIGLLLFLFAAPLYAQNTKTVIEDFGAKNSVDTYKQDISNGTLDGTRLIWHSDAYYGKGAMEAECHFLSKGNEYITFVKSGKWNFSVLDTLEFDMKGSGHSSDVYLALYDVHGHLVLYGPDRNHPDFKANNSEWKTYKVDLSRESNGDFDFSHVTKIGFMFNDGSAQDSYVGHVFLANIRVETHPAVLQIAHVLFSPNGDGVNDFVGVTVVANHPQKVTLLVKNSDENIIRTLDVKQSEDVYWKTEWDGRNDKGKLAPEGKYSLIVAVKWPDGSQELTASAQLISTPALKQTKITPDFFPIGAWFEGNAEWNHSTTNMATATQYYERQFSSLEAHGIDTVAIPNVPPVLRKMVLQIAEKHHLRIILEITELAKMLETTQDLDEREVRKVAEPIIAGLKDSPALLRYQIRDEPQTFMISNWILMKRVLGDLDPVHPAFSCFCSVETMDAILKTTHVSEATFDSYPLTFGQSTEQSLHSYNSILDLIYSHTNGRPMWMAIQAFGSKDQQSFPCRYPKAEELRALNYMTLTRNIKGIFFFVYQSENGWTGMIDDKEQPTPIYSEVAKLSGELKKLKSTLLTLSPASDIATAEGNVEMKCLADAFENPHFILASYDVNKPQDVTLKIQMMQRPQSILDLKTGKFVDYTYEMGTVISKIHLEAGDGTVLKVIK